MQLSEFNNKRSALNERLRIKNQNEVKKKEMEASYLEQLASMRVYEEALALLTSVSEENTLKTLSFIEDTINRALTLMFTGVPYQVKVRKYIRNESVPCLEVNLFEQKEEGQEIMLDFKLMSGNGISQVTSFLFTMCLISLRKLRPVVILDEVLNGFHEDAKPSIRTIINLFADNGFQFIMVEYGLLDLGKGFLVTQDRLRSSIAEEVLENDLSEYEEELLKNAGFTPQDSY